MRNRYVTSPALLTAASVLVVPTAALGSVADLEGPGLYASSRVIQSDPGGGLRFDSGVVDEGGMFGPHTAHTQHTMGSAPAISTADAQYGLLTASTAYSGNLISAGGERLVQGFASAAFSDQAVIAAGDGLTPGESVNITANFALNLDPVLAFSQSDAGSGFGFQLFAYSVEVVINDQVLTYTGAYRNEGGGSTLTSGADTPGLVSIDLPVIVGEAFTIAASIETGLYASVVGTSFDGGIQVGDGPHFEWLGITGLEPQQRVASSFFDWTFASTVPTPGPALLLAVGGASMLRRHRRGG